METKVMKVYYNEQGLPFKDSALTIPYSIIGSEFTGANNTTEIRFYVENIDNELTWVANIKLQDGTLTYRLLTPVIDEDNKTYQLLEMDNGITSKKGFIYLGLNGYGGETLIEEVEGVLTINGNPTIVATGTISIALNYTPIVVPLGTSVEPTEIQQILSALSIKQDKFNLNNVRGYDTLALATTDLPNLIEGQIVIVRGTVTRIYQVQAGELVALDSVGAYLPLAGGTMTGAISQPVAPVADTDLANKKYVDDEVAENTQDIADIIDGDLTVHTAYHAEMDVYGNVIPTYYQPKLTFDNTPTTGSTKPVTSGGIKTYVDAKIATTGGDDPSDYTSLINNAVNNVLSKTYYVYAQVAYPIYILKNTLLSGYAMVISSTGINVYNGTQGGTWTLYKTFSAESETGYSLSLNPTTFVLTLKNKAGGTLSSVDLPLESVVVGGSYDDNTQSLILTLQNGNTISIPVADLVAGLVPNTRTIAGVDLTDDITASELNTALGLATTDKTINAETYKELKIDTAKVQVQSAIEDKNGNDITTTYATKTEVVAIDDKISSSASSSNKVLSASEVVKTMVAPSSTTLTDKQITQIINGVFIQGTFLGYLNPVFYPARVTAETNYYGTFKGADETTVAVERVYIINKSTKVISVAPVSSIVYGGDGRIRIQVLSINGATYPASNPTGTEPYDLTIANGVYSFRPHIYEYAELYLADNTTAVSLSANTLTKFAISMTGGASDGITIDTTNVTATIVNTGVYKVEISFGNKASVDNAVLDTWVYKNTTTIIPQLQQRRTARNKEDDNVSTISGIVSLTAGDVLDVRVSASLACNLTVRNVSFSIHRIK